MTELQDVIETLDNAADSFESIATKEQKKIYDEVLTLTKDLETDASGKVKQSIQNLKRLTLIKAKLSALSKDKEWAAGISHFLDYFGILQKKQNEYYSSHFPEATLSAKAKEKNELMRQMAVQNTIDALMGDGLKANVTDKLNDILLRAVTSGAKFADLQEELRAHLLGKDGGQGAFAVHRATQQAHDARPRHGLVRVRGQQQRDHARVLRAPHGKAVYSQVGNPDDPYRQD